MGKGEAYCKTDKTEYVVESHECTEELQEEKRRRRKELELLFHGNGKVVKERFIKEMRWCCDLKERTKLLLGWLWLWL